MVPVSADSRARCLLGIQQVGGGSQLLDQGVRTAWESLVVEVFLGNLVLEEFLGGKRGKKAFRRGCGALHHPRAMLTRRGNGQKSQEPKCGESHAGGKTSDGPLARIVPRERAAQSLRSNLLTRQGFASRRPRAARH